MAVNITYYSVKLIKETSKRVELGDIKTIRSPEDAYNAIINIFQLHELPQEHLVMLALNVKSNIIGAFTVHIGTTNSSVLSPKDVFQRALLTNASSIIISHNHPSGNPDASPEDIEVTKNILEAGEILSIPLLDHIIVGDNCYISLKEEGYF